MDILLIDDEASVRRTIRIALETMHHRVGEARDSHQALEMLGHGLYSVAFLDLRLAHEQGLEVLPQLLQLAPGLDVVVITAYATIDTAVEAMRRGAVDYLPKPFTPDQLRLVLERIARSRRLHTQVEELTAQVRSVVPEADLQTREPAMRAAIDLALKAAPSDATILLRGESGTGKGILARTIHVHSARSAGPFITVHCPSLSAELLESELFGHVRGAFTGALKDTQGKVAVAHEGTLFLDEIGDLPSALQPKLLRLLQEKRYERVGETITRSSNVRILTATNRDLQADMAAGRFREDLLYRINVIEVTLPPLRQRPEDILPLATHLLAFFARLVGKTLSGFSTEVQAAFARYSWPGNIRELRNVLERGAILASGPEIGMADLPAQIGSPVRADMELGGRVTLEELEAEHIRRILTASTSIDEAAQILGIDPSTLYRKRKRYGL